MIIKSGVKLQLIAFAVITILGVSYVAVRYIGLGNGILGRRYSAYVDLSDSGGVFTNAEVTYRGVRVGRVGPIELTEDGIRVKLTLDRGRRIPREGLSAVVANRSAVGEQYIDLLPSRAGGPYLDEGEPYTIPRQNTRLPVSTAELLRNVDKLVSSVDPTNLSTIIDELDRAFSGSASDLQAILDSSDRLLKTAEEGWPDTSQLLDNSRVVLDTQRGQAGNIRGFARNLNVLTQQIREDDPGLRGTLDATIPAVRQGDKLLDQLSPALPVLLANLTTTGQIIASRSAGLRSLFILYPVTVAGAFTVTPDDGTQHLGLVLNSDAPPPCTKGYEKVKKRWPQFTEDTPARLDVGCTLPKDSQQVVRGARNSPPEAVKPPPKVPPGASDGAGFPPGGASGGPSGGSGGSGSEEPSSQAQGPEQSGRSGRSGQQGGSGDEKQVAALPQNSLYVPFSANSVTLAGYDPVTGVAYGSDGKRYLMGTTGSQQRLLGDASWKILLLGPLAK